MTPQPRRPVTARAVSRDVGLGLVSSEALRVDTADAAPPEMARFQSMNPFHIEEAWRIPVPGQQLRSRSVESIWQGLKVVDGTTDSTMLGARASKRPPEAMRGPDFDYAATRFQYGENEIDLVSARFLIYLPAYLYMLEHLVPVVVTDEIGHAAEHGVVVFYDWDDNFDITDDRCSFSHSAILASWFGGRLHETMLAPRAAWLAAHPAIAEFARGAPEPPLRRYHCLHEH